MKSFRAYVPTDIVFGSGVVKELHNHKLPGKKAMIVISNGKPTRANGYLDTVEGELRQAGVETVVFDRVEANPLRSTVMAGAAFARDNGCDFLLALGGGSVMDAAKVMAFMAVNPGDVWDYIAGGTGKAQPRQAAPLPLVCVTTTAGTGSEADPYGVISNDETNEKIGFHADFPVLSIVDPELMLSVPPVFTAYQGFDALFHSTECYVSSTANAMSDMYALTAIENVAKYLARAVNDGNDLEAREHVAFGNTLSGIVMNIASTTAKHSLEHAMSAYHHALPHGAGLIMISKAFYEYFIERHACDERFVRMAQAMGMPEASRPEDFITMLVKLQEECGVAGLKMSDYGITPEEFDTLARNARETMGGLFLGNPCELDHAGSVEILRKSYR